MPLRAAVPANHIGASSPAQFHPPVAVVGGVLWRTVLNALESVPKFRETVLKEGSFVPIGHLEVGATLLVSPKDAALPGVFEGETHLSRQSLLFMGLELSLDCKINLFHDAIATSLTEQSALGLGYVGNRGGMNNPGAPVHLSRSGLVAYFTHMLGSNPISLDNKMPMFGIVHTHEKFYEYIIILNARLSSPGRAFPIGGSPTTLHVEIYTTGLGLFVSNLPKVGDEVQEAAAPNIHIIDAIDKASAIAALSDHLGIKRTGVIVNPGHGVTLKIHGTGGRTNQLIRGKVIPITPLAIWGGSGNEGERPLDLITNYVRIVMA